MQSKKNYRSFEQYSPDEIANKVAHELSSMAYDVTVKNSLNGAVVTVKNDTGIVDSFLGRWQCFDVCIDNTFSADCGYSINVKIEKRAWLDKILCFIVGLFTFTIPWIFCFIARANRKNAEQVAEKIAGDFVTKHNNEYLELHGMA